VKTVAKKLGAKKKRFEFRFLSSFLKLRIKKKYNGKKGK
jgi:hypothetical protein